MYDQPFYTQGATCVDVQPAGQNGKSCNGTYYGVSSFYTDFDPDQFSAKMGIDVTRQNASGTLLGTRTIGNGLNCPTLCGMRHFAARPGDSYILRFKSSTGTLQNAKWLELQVSNLQTASDSFLLGVAFDGATPISSLFTTVNRYNNRDPRNINVAGTSIAAVQNDTTGRTYYQDKANNLLWIRIQGGQAPDPGWNTSANSDDQLYKRITLKVNH